MILQYYYIVYDPLRWLVYIPQIRIALFTTRYFLSFQPGGKKKNKEDKPKTPEPVGMNVKSIVIIRLLMMLMLFAVHCTWITSNAYSSPSIVLASYGPDG